MSSPRLALEIRAGLPFELLIALSAVCDPRRDREADWPPRLEQLPDAVRSAVERVGDRAGETWLHLLGLAIESSALDVLTFVDEAAALDGVELRRYLLGVHVPAWRALVGLETIERAARGDAAAARDLLASDRYYGGRAEEALGATLPLTPAQTKRRFVAALKAFAGILQSRGAELGRILEEDARRRRAAREEATPEAVIAGATRGYAYEVEPEFARVVLVPHLAAAPSLLLCQHGDARVICYPAEPAGREPDVSARAVRLGKALGDPARVAIVRALASGEVSLTEAARAAGVARSTAHHHLAILRAAGIVTVRGNARGYWYALHGQGIADARALLGELAVPG
jgi:DNA-binding transcriptional ArsR family regulator